MTEAIALEHLLSHGRAPDTVVAWRAGSPLSFADFVALATGWHHTFTAHTGQRFSLYCDDSLDFAAALFGAWHAGKCIYLPGDRLPATLARLDAVVDAHAGDLPDALQPAIATPGAISWQPLNPDAEQLVIYTSGSTGEPMAIGKHLRQLFSEVKSLASCFDAQWGDGIVQATVSHQHIYGLLFRILWPLASGRPFATTRLAFPEDIARTLTLAPAILVASPAHLKRLPPALPWADGQANLQAIFSSGGPLPTDALHDCRQLLNQAPFEVFGSSETGGMAWRQRWLNDAAPWQSLPGVSLRVQDGLLQVASPHCADMIWQNTSTRAELTAAGLQLGGRSDRIVKIEEKRVSLTEMEQALLATSLVSEVRLLALDGPRLTLGVVATPSPAGWDLHDRQGKRALNETLRQALGRLVEATALPRRWRYVWTLPINPQGKVTEAALATCFDPRRPTARLLARDEAEATLALDIETDSPHFEGHFPGLPVLPGVTQIDWAILIGRELFMLPPEFLRLEQVKFQQVITPGMKVTLALAHQAERNSLTFKFTSARGAHASGRVVFGAAS